MMVLIKRFTNANELDKQMKEITMKDSVPDLIEMLIYDSGIKQLVKLSEDSLNLHAFNIDVKESDEMLEFEEGLECQYKSPRQTSVYASKYNEVVDRIQRDKIKKHIDDLPKEDLETLLTAGAYIVDIIEAHSSGNYGKER